MNVSASQHGEEASGQRRGKEACSLSPAVVTGLDFFRGGDSSVPTLSPNYFESEFSLMLCELH